MTVFHTPLVRGLLPLAVLLSALFFMQPVQQTVYAAVCCTDCFTNYQACMSGCTDGLCQRMCYLDLKACSSQCDSSC